MKWSCDIKHLLVFLILLWLGPSFASDIILVEDTDPRLIGEKIGYYSDDSNEKTIDEIIALNAEGKFTPNDKKVFAQPSSAATHWFTFSVRSEIQSEIWIDVFNQGFQYISFYLLDEQGNMIDTARTGVLLPPETRRKRSKTFWFNLFEKDEEGLRTVYIKIDFSGILEVPILLGGYDELVSNEDESELYGILFIGALVIMLLYNISLWYFTKDIVYLYYCGYILFVLFITTQLNNYPVLHLIIGSDFTYNHIFVWISPVYLFIALFTINYLQLNSYDKRAAVWVKVTAGVAIFVGMLNIFISPFYLTNVFQFAAIFSLLVCLVVGFREWAKGSKRARFYSIGWSINAISVFIFIGVSNGFITFNVLSRNVMYIGILMELTIFSIALAERLNKLRNDQFLLNQKLENANSKLRETNASLDTFNYHVSHDLKTVLNNTLGLSRMARKYNAKRDEAKVDEIMAKLEGVALNGVETVHSFLSLGRIDSLLKDENIQWIRLEDEVAETIRQHDLTELIEVEVMENQIGQIQMHPKVFESIFLNFFTNTIKYNENAPKGWIRFLQDDETFVFEYMDNGIGIDMEKFGDELFKPFQRGAGNKGREGTGVGLYLVKRIVESFKGTISVSSSLGDGAVFTIKLPRNKA